MKRIDVIAAALAIIMLQACAMPREPETDGVTLNEETSIPFFNSTRNAVISWQPDGREGLWVQGARRDWYYAKLAAPCMGIENTIRVGFDTGPTDRLDRFSKVIVPGEPISCTIASFTKSSPPPDGNRRTLDGEQAK